MRPLDDYQAHQQVMAPALIAESIKPMNILATVMPTPVAKLAQTAARVVRFQ